MRKTLSLVLVSGFWMLSTNASAQSIAEAARQERERRGLQVANKTYTNEDIAAAEVTGTAPAPTPAAPAATTENSATEAPVGPTDSKGRDEKFWRTQFATARADLKRAEDQIRVTELKINELNLQMLRQSDIYNREQVLTEELNKINAELTNLRLAANASRQKIADLEEELRRSGGLAGWAR